LRTAFTDVLCALLEPNPDCSHLNFQSPAPSNVDQLIRELRDVSSQGEGECGADISRREPQASAVPISEVKMIENLTTLVDQSGEHLRTTSQDKQRHLTGSLAMQPSCDVLYQGTYNRGTVYAPGAGSPNSSGDLDTSSTSAARPGRERKRAFCRRTKTGCITCRQRRKKCDENQPSCMRSFSVGLVNDRIH
jgi:hypothetical protein